MKVIVWTAHFLPHVGGVENFSARLWPKIVEAGHSVKLITCNTDRASFREDFQGVSVVRLSSFNLLSGRYPIPLLWKHRSCFERCDFDVAVTNTRFFLTSFLGARIAKRCRRPLIHVEHGSGWRVTGSFVVNTIVRAVDKTIGRWILGNANVVCAVSSDAASYIRRLVPREVVLLPNGIDTKLFESHDMSLRHEFGISPHETVIVFAGRLVKEKGILEYLQVASQICRNDTHFFVAGSGPLMKHVQEAAQRNPKLHYLGAVPPGEMPRLYSAADIVCHPSYYLEGLPTVVLEAGAAGCCVIAARTTGISDLIPSDEYGLIVDPRNVVQLQTGLTTLIENPNRRQAIADRLRKRIREEFDITLVAKRMEALLTSALTRTRESTASG